jgi:hypothetical protein
MYHYRCRNRREYTNISACDVTFPQKRHASGGPKYNGWSDISDAVGMDTEPQLFASSLLRGTAPGSWVEALCYKSEGPGFESRQGQWIFQLIWCIQPHYMTLESIQPLTEISTKNSPAAKVRPASPQGWQPHCHLWAYCLENKGASTSHNPIVLHGLLRE